MAKEDVTLERGDREHRHRRAVDAAQRGEELQQRDGGDGCRRLRPRDCRDGGARRRHHACGSGRSWRSRCSSAPREYDTAIANFLGQCQDGTRLHLHAEPAARPRVCATGTTRTRRRRSTAAFSECFSQLQGKELSYTNILDIEAAADLILDFVRPTVAILKHTNPCGVGQDDEDLRDGVAEGLRDRPAGAVRRGDRLQPPA